MTNNALSLVRGFYNRPEHRNEVLRGIQVLENQIKEAEIGQIVAIQYGYSSRTNFGGPCDGKKTLVRTVFVGYREKQYEIGLKGKSLTLPIYPCVSTGKNSPNIADGRLIIPYRLTGFSLDASAFFQCMRESEFRNQYHEIEFSQDIELIKLWLSYSVGRTNVQAKLDELTRLAEGLGVLEKPQDFIVPSPS